MSFFKRKEKEKKNNQIVKKTKNSGQINLGLVSTNTFYLSNTKEAIVEQEFFPIEVQELPLDFKIDDLNLYEIKDISIITRINGLVQGGTQQLLQNIHQTSIQKLLKVPEDC